MNLHTADPGYYQLDRRDLAALVPPDCRSVLEVGCGFGALGRALIERQGCVIDGIEINPEAETPLRNTYRQVWIGNVEQLALPDAARNYDCLLFPDVLEHLVDPWTTLRVLCERLQPGGCVVASLPNIRNFAILYRLIVQGNWEYEDSGILDRGHLRFFTRRSITTLFENSGLVIETWQANRDRPTGLRRAAGALARLLVHDSDVCQYLLRARKP